MTDYSSGDPWAKSDMVLTRMGAAGKKASIPLVTEYIRSAHAEIAQLLYDEYVIDPSAITTTTSGYVQLQTAEADVATGLWEEDTEIEREIIPMVGKPARSVRYTRGMERIRAWATNYVAGGEKPNSRFVRVKRTVSNRRDYLTDHYGD